MFHINLQKSRSLFLVPAYPSLPWQFRMIATSSMGLAGRPGGQFHLSGIRQFTSPICASKVILPLVVFNYLTEYLSCIFGAFTLDNAARHLLLCLRNNKY